MGRGDGDGTSAGIGPLAIFAGASVLSWLAMYLLVARPQALAAPFLTEMLTWEDSFPPLRCPWLLPWWLLTTHTGNMLAYPHGGNHFGSVVTAILVGFGITSLRRRDVALLVFLLAPMIPGSGCGGLASLPVWNERPDLAFPCAGHLPARRPGFRGDRPDSPSSPPGSKGLHRRHGGAGSAGGWVCGRVRRLSLQGADRPRVSPDRRGAARPVSARRDVDRLQRHGPVAEDE